MASDIVIWPDLAENLFEAVLGDRDRLLNDIYDLRQEVTRLQKLVPR